MGSNLVVPPLTQSPTKDSLALKQVWESIQPDSCPHHYNFHMHTVCSDGKLAPHTLMAQAFSIGLKGMAITDHHSIGGYQAAQQWLDDLRSQHPYHPLPHLWTGVEVTSSLLNTEVHILGYAFEPEDKGMQPYLQGERPQGHQALAKTVIEAIHQAGGLVVLAHPARYHRPARELIPAAADLGIDGVEAYYAYGNPKPWKASVKESEQVTRLCDAHGLFSTCGTDTHGLNLLHRL